MTNGGYREKNHTMGSQLFKIQGPFRSACHQGHQAEIPQKFFGVSLERAQPAIHDVDYVGCLLQFIPF